MYEKHTQTISTSTDDLVDDSTEILSSVEEDEDEGEKMNEKAISVSNKGNNQSDSPKKSKALKNQLNDEEKHALLQSPEMDIFLERTSRLMERILDQSEKTPVDFMIDYGTRQSSLDTENKFTYDSTSNSSSTNHSILREVCFFQEERYSKDRSITCIDLSPFYPELCLVAYNKCDNTSNKLTSSGNDFLQQSSTNSITSTDLLIKNGSMMDYPDGCVLLWSSILNSRPEYSFFCQSPVLSAIFHPFDRHVIIGGCYSGQIVFWDTRAKSSPVQKSPMSSSTSSSGSSGGVSGGGGHTHPIYSMVMVGTQNAHSLITASTDGRLCVWNPNNLMYPTDVLDLVSCKSIKSASKSILQSSMSPTNSDGSKSSSDLNSGSSNIIKEKKIPVSISSISFRKEENNEVCIGSESGHIFTTQIHSKDNLSKETPSTVSVKSSSKKDHDQQLPISPQQRTVVVKNLTSENSGNDLSSFSANHFGCVTSLAYNPFYEQRSDSLLLSSSVDWTVKLWSAKLISQNSEQPLYSFEAANDYIYDAQWSPIHPALFATAIGDGKICLWNINIDTEVPLIERKISTKALSRIKWSVDGSKLVVGDSKGDTFVFEVASEVALPQPDELSRLENKVEELITLVTSSSS